MLSGIDGLSRIPWMLYFLMDEGMDEGLIGRRAEGSIFATFCS